MASLLPRRTSYVCRACRSRQHSLNFISQSRSQQAGPLTTRQPVQQQKRALSSKIPSSSRASRPPTNRTQSQSKTQTPTPQRVEPTPAPSPTRSSKISTSVEDVPGTLRDVQLQVNAICASTSLPDEAQVLEVMDKAYKFSNILVFGRTTAPEEEEGKTLQEEEEEEAAANYNLVSDLEEPNQPSRKQVPITSPSQTHSSNPIPSSQRERSAQTLCNTIYTLLKDPKTLISEPILSIYVRIICQLGNPEYLPEIFFLYAHKPQPVPNTSNPIQYRNPSPNSPKNAVPQELSDVALDTAILQRDLALAVAIIDTTVGTRAFRLNKFMKKASLPTVLVGTTPVAAYAAAEWVANWQNSLDPNMAKAITMMASLAYVGTLTTIGFVAVTTWNDHHERVRWTEGTPLRYRWMREEERLYFDRVAMAWGFQRARRRGEEMGRLWEELREECGVRGFVLDKSDLLPGMA